MAENGAARVAYQFAVVGIERKGIAVVQMERAVGEYLNVSGRMGIAVQMERYRRIAHRIGDEYGGVEIAALGVTLGEGNRVGEHPDGGIVGGQAFPV